MSQQGQQGGQEGSYDYLWGAAALIFLVIIIWFTAKDYIILGVFYIKLAELKVIGLFTDHEEPLVRWILSNMSNPGQLTAETIGNVLSEVGYYIKFPFGIFLCMLGFYIFSYHDSARFNKSFDMKRLLSQEKKLWPQISPISKIDLLNTPIHKGPWRMSLSPMQFAKLHKIIIPPTGPKIMGVDQVASIDEKRATLVFKKQMGEKVTNLDALPIYCKALFGAFSAIALENRKVGYKLLLDIARTTSDGKPDYLNAQAVFDQYKNHPKVQRVVVKHAYRLTLMASMLEFARIDGVLASSDFLWLKIVDRPLWYMLNNVGRQTAFTEVGGPFCHWISEKAIGRGLNQPLIDNAVVALREAIEAVVYVEDEDDEQL